MEFRQVIRRIHIGGTAWFMVCSVVLLVIALREAGAGWLLIFSLSGFSAVLIGLLISIYMFAIFRGVVRYHEPIEHPLTTSPYYIALYDSGPFLGALAGLVGSIGQATIGQILITIATGTLSLTFILWIVIDPLIGLTENLLPKSRHARKRRLIEIRAAKHRQQQESLELLNRIVEQEKANQAQWQRQLEPLAEELIRILSCEDSLTMEAKVVGIGARAWQAGGVAFMRLLHLKVKGQLHDKGVFDPIPDWWDGVGRWKNRPEEIIL